MVVATGEVDIDLFAEVEGALAWWSVKKYPSTLFYSGNLFMLNLRNPIFACYKTVFKKIIKYYDFHLFLAFHSA